MQNPFNYITTSEHDSLYKVLEYGSDLYVNER